MQMLSDKMDCLQVTSFTTRYVSHAFSYASSAVTQYGLIMCMPTTAGSHTRIIVMGLICVVVSQEAHKALEQLEARARHEALQGDVGSLTVDGICPGLHGASVRATHHDMLSWHWRRLQYCPAKPAF